PTHPPPLPPDRRKYGKVFTFWPGNEPMIVVAEPKMVRQILTDTQTFIKGSDYSNKFALVFGEGLVTSNGSKHKTDRSCLAKYFIKSGVEKYMGFMCSQTNDMIKTMLVPKHGQNLDLQEFFHMLALRIFGEFSCGHDYSTDPEAKWINHQVSHGSHVIGEHIVLGLPVWSWIPRIKKLKGVVNKMHLHIEKLIQNRLALRANPPSEDWVEPEDPLKGLLDSNASRKDMYEQITTLLSAGHDTTAFFACYMAYLIAEHPEVQQKMKKEVKSVLQGREEVTPEDIKNMPYTGNVMKEVLRMYTVIPFVNRTTTKDVTLTTQKDPKLKTAADRDVKLPKGSVTLLPLFLMNRDPDVWENPNDFNPDRFNDLKIFDSSAKLGYLPFAYGSRTCIGNTLALTEGQVMFALLMQKCTFTKIEGFRPKITAGISLVSTNGINVKITMD
ncbi:hypothetical protein TeGR_g67, partial [Tetraparma gracilis]